MAKSKVYFALDRSIKKLKLALKINDTNTKWKRYLF